MLAAILAGGLAEQFGTTVPRTGAEAEAHIVAHLGADATRLNVAVEWEGRAVGNVGLSNIEHRNNTAWAYYWVSAPARGRGIARRALSTIADHAFASLKLHRLELGHRTNNPASCRVAEAAGFHAEGIERDKLRYGAERFDVETHARLATDPAPHVDLLTLQI